MSDNLAAPNVGTGPYDIEHDAEGGFYVTQDGVRTGKVYYVGKTAYRTARKLNEAHTGEAAPLEAGAFLDDEPVIAEPNPDPENPAEDLGPKPVAKAKAAKPVAKPKAKAPKVKVALQDEPKAPKVKVALPDEPKKVYDGTREQWLNAFIAAARPIFKALELELPEKIRASVGFMFRGGKAIGQCWHEAASTDGTREIFVIPTLDDSYRIADVLTHELAHTLFGPDEKHGRNFKAAVTKLGLEGKATATIAGPGWLEWASPILEDLGRIPHAAIDPTLSGVKKQKTYLIKASCTCCDVIFRITAKAANGKELRCVDADCDGLVTLEGAEDLGEGDGE